jgi:hypothetical protein
LIKYLFLALLLSTQAFSTQLNPNGYFRAMYLGDKDSTASAVGGMVGVAPSFGVINSRVALYAVSALANQEDSKTKLFSDSTNAYALLGEASLGYKDNKFDIIAGRQKVVTPLVDMDDGRIIPNLYEGVSLKYKFTKETSLEAYYLRRMSGFWSQIFSGHEMSNYVGMSDSTGYGNITHDSPLWSIGVKNGNEDYKLSAWAYYVPDLMHIFFAEYQKNISLEQNTKLQLSVQGSKQSADGKVDDDLKLRGKTLDQDYVGFKIALTQDKINGYIATTLVNDSKGKLDNNMMNIWAGIPQYTVVNEYVMKSFDTDGAKMYKAQLGYIFTDKTSSTLSYLYFDGLDSRSVKDESVGELVVSTKFEDFSLNGVALLHTANNTSQAVFKATLQYNF